MCQRFIENFTDKVIEKLEPSHFYLFTGCIHRAYLREILSFQCDQSELRKIFYDHLSEFQPVELIKALSYHLDFMEKCECDDCLDWYGSVEPAEIPWSQGIQPIQNDCDGDHYSSEIGENYSEILAKLLPLLDGIDLMEIEKYTNGHFFMVRDRTGVVKKLLNYI